MKKIKFFVSALLITAMSMSIISCSSSKEGKENSSKKELDSSVREEIHQNAENTDLLKGELENKKIKFKILLVLAFLLSSKNQHEQTTNIVLPIMPLYLKSFKAMIVPSKDGTNGNNDPLV